MDGVIHALHFSLAHNPTPHFAGMHVWDVCLGCVFGRGCQKCKFGKSSLNRLTSQSILSTTVQEDKTLLGGMKSFTMVQGE